MLTLFWDAEGCILLDLQPRKKTVNVVCCIQTLHKVRYAFHDKVPNERHIILQHNSACPHTADLTLGKTDKFGWEVIPHPLYSADLALSDYYLFKHLKDHRRFLYYQNDDAVQQTMCTLL
jgi:histone-lysine N-methyltransferase SETMAR